WINDCEYIVKKKNPKNQAEKRAIHMKILSTEGNTYQFEYNLVGEPRKEKGTAVKVSE
ncbi:MAG TPA: DNA topoisomerase IV, partial [Flavobacteriaceae bacterium]|nr:DNA topoisomerase IV [Flavobacteriaceae bacterium]